MKLEEEFKDIDGFEGLYKVSNLGRVLSLKRKGVPVDKILKDKKASHGYRCVNLYKDRKCFTLSVHRLVASLFIGSLDGLTVDHINNNKEDNNVNNLQIMSQCDNYDKYLSTKYLVLDVETGVFYKSIKEASEFLGIHKNTLRYRINNFDEYKLKMV